VAQNSALCLAVFTLLGMAACSASSASNGSSLGGNDSGAGTSSGASSSGASSGGASSSGAGIGDGGPSPSQADATDATDGGLVTYGKAYTDGVYNLGPVDYSESQFHNACAPLTKYDPRVQAVEGTLLAGLWNGIPDTENYCDACIWVVTGKGKSAMLRVVTYGETTTDSIDTSPQAFSVLNESEYPRIMTWQLAKCPDTGPMMYEFQTGSSEYWTSLWVRNARVPLAKVEVESTNHKTWFELQRGNGDGTLTDANGFGVGTFTIRSTGVDGQQVTDTFPWPSGGVAGAFLTGQGNFR
jgi:expansin (peptidoglycan-binding protein)